nr:immunoglobulin heavy chain junction region [Macaca mulatta]MOW86827.1 immunoglobulin heavy chain junction region [Macaca mulatta]MOW87111.1 immunoglobulin heavy chain junction region [Macaca mulatta]MOW87316.1 immunoglobulin heavy chain junction region [Macaca mulatta]MOW87357.1 immunoglobulin heavy chain junction region [Macaca mulatta]
CANRPVLGFYYFDYW